MGARLIAVTPNAEEVIEESGRICYDSAPGDAEKFIGKLIKRGHDSVLEHASATFEVECSRACSHQLVRHRIASYSQRSQRYVKENEPQYVMPNSIAESPEAALLFTQGMEEAWGLYGQLLRMGVKPEDARFVLPNACLTKLRVTMNFRSWRHFIAERGLNPHAQWEIRGIAIEVLTQLYRVAPSCFEDMRLTLLTHDLRQVGAEELLEMPEELSGFDTSVV